jgi:CheY-like chemotaxis protein
VSSTAPSRRDPAIFLLVEDDENDTYLAKRAFQRIPGSIVHAVKDGEQAVAYLTRQPPYNDDKLHPCPDVILLDLKMPRMNGFDVLKWVRAQTERELRLLPVVVLSSSNLQEDVKKAYALGANSYLVKPVQWEELVRVLTSLNEYWADVVETPAVRSGVFPLPEAARQPAT